MLRKNCPVLCIPKIPYSIKLNTIKHVFDNLKLGPIQKINSVNMNNGFHKVIIYFNYWIGNEKNLAIESKIMNNETMYIPYDGGIFRCVGFKKNKI
jgi:hypothetical protein